VPSDVLVNERVVGFHVGVGSADAADRWRNLHLDFIVLDCRVALGAHVILSHGRFAPARSGATPGLGRHPVPVRLHDAL